MNTHAVSTRRPVSRDATGEAEWVHRFGFTERFAHWWTVSMVAGALLTGLAVGDEGEGGLVLNVHVAAVILIGVGLAGALIIGDHRALLRAARALFTFESRDVTWIRDRARRPFAHEHPDESGMFNPGQKVLAWALAIAITAVIATGVQSWSSGGEGGPHGATVVVAAVLLGAHIFMAVVNPATRPALAGMVFGRVRRSWAARHHAGWLKDMER